MTNVLTNDVISSTFQGQNHEKWMFLFIYANTMLIHSSIKLINIYI